MISDFLKNLRDKIDKNLHELYPGTGAAEVKPEFTAPDPGVKRYDVPAGTKRLPRGALQGRRELVSVSVPASVRTIGERAFAGCENLESVTLHEGLRQIGENAFDGCKSLKRIVIPNSVKDVNGSAFKGSGIVEPVRTASGDTLIYCPASAAAARTSPSPRRSPTRDSGSTRPWSHSITTTTSPAPAGAARARAASPPTAT